MSSHDMALGLLTALDLCVLAYAFYLSRQIDALNARRDRRQDEAAARLKARPSPVQ